MDSSDNMEDAAMEISNNSEDDAAQTVTVEATHSDDDDVSEYGSIVSAQAPSGNITPNDLIEEESNQSEASGVQDLEAKEVEKMEEVSRKRPLEEEEDHDDGTLCPICLDNWTNTGDHRICALKCGHLFGYKCINRWLQSQTKKSCPTCKKKVGRSDLRYIYAKKLIAVDNGELEALQKQLDAAAEEKNRVMCDLTKSICREQSLSQEVIHLRKKIYELTQKYDTSSVLMNHRSNIQSPARLFMDKSLPICKSSGCRVLDANSSRDLLVTSMKSVNHLFNGYGLREINISCYKPLSFIPTHTQQIRDVCFHPGQMWVLSVGMDKLLKIVDLTSSIVVQSVAYQMPLWSCCWDADNGNYLYAGAQSGAVLKYDVRGIQEPVAVLSVPGDTSPVVSVASIPAHSVSGFANGGIISCKLNSLWMFENGAGYIRHSLPLEGPFVSMKYQKNTGQLLVSSRPNSRYPYSRHTVSNLQKTSSDIINCHTLYSFQGGGMQKLLSKSCFISNENDMVAAYNESNKCVYLWSINTGQKVASVPAHDAVLDLCGVQNNNGNFLLSLTERKLEFFKFSY